MPFTNIILIVYLLFLLVFLIKLQEPAPIQPEAAPVHMANKREVLRLLCATLLIIISPTKRRITASMYPTINVPMTSRI